MQPNYVSESRALNKIKGELVTLVPEWEESSHFSP